jgi:general nucleoside transport system permease protein
MAFIVGVLSAAIISGTSVLYATLGELLGERAGIVNLGLEGVMLMGASIGFAVAAQTENAAAGLLAGAVVGGLFNMVFAFLVVTRRANQLASGLALMFFGQGLSALLGKPYVGVRIEGINEFPIPVLRDIPIVGPALFNHDILVYLVVPTAILIWWVLYRTRWGLNIRTVGESPTTAFAAGLSPSLLKYQALLVAGVLGGIAGAHLSLAFTKTWAEGMSAGRGFIAVALVIFSMWRPLRTIAGALLFGGAVALQLQMQAAGARVSPFLLDMLPYLLTLVVLILWGRNQKYAAPAWLGRSYDGVE